MAEAVRPTREAAGASDATAVEGRMQAIAARYPTAQTYTAVNSLALPDAPGVPEAPVSAPPPPAATAPGFVDPAEPPPPVDAGEVAPPAYAAIATGYPAPIIAQEVPAVPVEALATPTAVAVAPPVVVVPDKDAGELPPAVRVPARFHELERVDAVGLTHLRFINVAPAMGCQCVVVRLHVCGVTGSSQCSCGASCNQIAAA